MPDKIKVAINWASACGGCDVALLDVEEKILDLVAVADVVYWPVAMDFKREHLEAYGPKEIDVGIFNGAIRTNEHEEDALILRDRCKVLIAYGACSCFGGIPGLANLHHRDAIFDCVYQDTPSTDNPDGNRPQTETMVNGRQLELPEFSATTRALNQVVPVDYFLPGCPPTMDRVIDAVKVIIGFANTGELPPPGTVIASAKALCDECPRSATRTGKRISSLVRPHQVLADPEICFIEQGILCSGIATRGGCGASCINVNMPCRGCYGPTAEMLDPAAEALSTIGSIVAHEHEDELPRHKRVAPLKSIEDLCGTFYRFTLPSAVVFRKVEDGKKYGHSP
ncbi:MAG: oxidoreductase [Proteobacteria bacterium]|jgi:F420-non-reducing hydrogenase small subunit|nr:oxidoreductase [Pseudomonadota bacterium]